MKNRTLTKQNISDSINLKLGFSKEEAKRFIDFVLSNISNQLLIGKDVKISSLGTFKIRSKKERVGRNPKTGIEAKISSRKVVTFKSSTRLRQKINSNN